jgi:hypothetical protein
VRKILQICPLPQRRRGVPPQHGSIVKSRFSRNVNGRWRSFFEPRGTLCALHRGRLPDCSSSACSALQPSRSTMQPRKRHTAERRPDAGCSINALLHVSLPSRDVRRCNKTSDPARGRETFSNAAMGWLTGGRHSVRECATRQPSFPADRTVMHPGLASTRQPRFRTVRVRTVQVRMVQVRTAGVLTVNMRMVQVRMVQVPTVDMMRMVRMEEDLDRETAIRWPLFRMVRTGTRSSPEAAQPRLVFQEVRTGAHSVPECIHPSRRAPHRAGRWGGEA